MRTAATTFDRLMQRRQWLYAVTVFAAVLALRLPHALHTYQPDDAYITYRYAANLAAGDGFVYNRGDRTLGTTSPLLALLLTIPAALHLDIPTAAGALSLLASAACCAIVCDLLWFASGSLFGGLAAALLLIVSPLQLHIATSGMEPALLCLLMALSLSLLLRGHTRWAALCAGLAAVTRPEGLLWLPLAALLMRRDGRYDSRAIVYALLPPVLWAIFATAYFGSPLPQSMLAKVEQGHLVAVSSEQVIRALLDRLSAGPLYALLVLCGSLLAFSGRRALLICLAFSVLFVAAYAVSRPAIYLWYAAPLELCAIILIGFGVGTAVVSLCKLNPSRLRVRTELPPLALLGLMVILAVPRVLDYPLGPGPGFGANANLAAARWVAGSTTPADRILIGDVGYVGFYNLDLAVYDYYGLVWRPPPGALSQPLTIHLRQDVLQQMIALCRPTMILTEGGKAPANPPPGYHWVPMPEVTGRVAFIRKR